MYMGIEVGSIIKTQLILCSVCVFNNVPLCHVPYPVVRGLGLSGQVILCCPLCGASQVSQEGFGLQCTCLSKEFRQFSWIPFQKFVCKTPIYNTN